MNTAVDRVNARRAEIERMFAYLARLRPLAVVTSCGWLLPSAFYHRVLGAWWSDILASVSAGASMQDADAAVTAAVVRHGLREEDFDAAAIGQSPEGLAREIHRLAGIASAGHALGDMARAVARMDDVALREIAETIITPGGAGGNAAQQGRLDAAASSLVEMIEAGDTSIRSGIPKLDRWFGGWPRSELTLIAGRPGMGKTVLGMQTAEHMARSGHTVVMFSLEMSREMLIARRASAISGVIWRDVLTGQVSHDDRLRFQRAAARWVGEVRNLLVYDGGYTASQMWEIAAAVSADVVIVDHMSLVEGERGENENLRQGNISKTLKRLAKALKIPVIVLVQLSRAVEQRSDKRPVLSDLRDSGEHEQNADNVLMLYRDDYYNPVKHDVVPAEVLVRKFRNGPRMELTVAYDKRKFWFCERRQE